MNTKIIIFALICSNALLASEASSQQKKEIEKDQHVPNKLEGFSMAKAFIKDLLTSERRKEEEDWQTTNLPTFLRSAAPSTAEPTPTAKETKPLSKL